MYLDVCLFIVAKGVKLLLMVEISLVSEGLFSTPWIQNMMIATQIFVADIQIGEMYLLIKKSNYPLQYQLNAMKSLQLCIEVCKIMYLVLCTKYIQILKKKSKNIIQNGQKPY